MTEELFRDDATLTSCEARITCIDERGVQLERTIFYPLGGGQAGDRGALMLPDGRGLQIADTHNGARTGEVQHVPAARQEARLDFHIGEPLDKGALTAVLARLVGEARPVRHRWIADSGSSKSKAWTLCPAAHMSATPPGSAPVGTVFVTRIEKKSAMTRRVVLAFAGLATRAN